MHNIKSVFYGLLIGFAILVGIGITFGIIYEKEVSQYLIIELNKSIESKIDVDDVNLSLIKKFPQASLEFKNVIAYTKPDFEKEILGFNTDTLFFAKSLSVQINLFDLFSKKYIVKGIHLNDGIINLFINRGGDPNYIFWNTNEEKQSNEFELDIDQVKITNSKVLFINDIKDVIVKSDVNKLNLKGNFSNRNYLMQIKSELIIELLEVNRSKYIENKVVKSNINLDVINNDLRISNGDFNFNGLDLTLNGLIRTKDYQELDLSFTGKSLNIKRFIGSLPNSIKKEINNYEFSGGSATCKLSLHTNDYKRSKVATKAEFFINDAHLLIKNKNLSLVNLNVDGEYSNGSAKTTKTSSINLKQFSTQLENNLFKGDIKISNFNDPTVKGKLNADIYLNEIKTLFKLDSIERFSGYSEIKMEYDGTYNDLKNIKIQDLFTQEIKLNVELFNCEMKLVNNPILVSDIIGNVKINKDLKTDSLLFIVQENDFLLKGTALGLDEYFNKKSDFEINAYVSSRKINLNELAPLFKVDKNSIEESSYKFPEYINLNLDLDIENFEVGKFNATNISGTLNYTPKRFSLHGISFKSMNGDVRASGVIVQKYNHDFLVKYQGVVSNININQMFYSFNDFGQNFITNQNLQGNLSGDIKLKSEWNNKIEIKKNSIIAECDVNIENGELNNFETLSGLSRFIDEDELKSIKFSDFKNEITIKDEKIYIPQMDIKSSAMNLTASGEHSFNNEYEYHISVLLSDLLTSKWKSDKRDKDYGDADEDKGRIRLNLLLEGDKDKFSVKRDRKTARQRRKENLQKEKTELNQILKKEFGKSGNKTDSISSKAFKIEFEGDEKTKKQKKAKKTTDSPKFIIEWEEDSTSGN